MLRRPRGEIAADADASLVDSVAPGEAGERDGTSEVVLPGRPAARVVEARTAVGQGKLWTATGPGAAVAAAT
jgi:hypothetical protein